MLYFEANKIDDKGPEEDSEEERKGPAEELTPEQ